MAATTGTKIVKDGLVLNIDAANVGKNAGLTNVQYLIVAGGGGSSEFAGGGGAGGLLTGTITVTSQSYTITVGDGGAANLGNGNGNNGQNSSALGFTAIGGGGGQSSNISITGISGGSGGGNGPRNSPNPGSGTAGQGNSGGTGNPGETGQNGGSGGGGGAGSPGENGSFRKGGNGGAGISSAITGNFQYYAGGGGGFGDARNAASIRGSGGLGGGGQGASGANGDNSHQPGTPNTGGGAGGCGPSGPGGKSGGSGIVVIRYPGPQRAIGGTVTRVGNDTVHTYTTVGSSTFEPLTYVNNTAFAAVPDLSNNGNIGTAVNSPVYNSDNGGNIVVDGIDDYILIGPVSGTGTSTSSVSWNIWVYATGTSGNIMSMSIANPQDSWNMPPIIASGQRFAGKVWSNTRLTSFIYTLNVWYQVTLVWDANQNSQFFYVNGELQGFQSAISYSASEANNFLFLGQTNPGADNTGMFAGKYGTFQVYNKALSQQEVQQNFEATRGRYGI